ncbi:MAG: OmpA family protein [bacterium]|nr:OmpA family protein [Candidatus Minthenecus merdequi]
MKKIFFILLLLVTLSTNAQVYDTKSKAAIKYYQQAGMAISTREKEELLQKAIDKDEKFSQAYFALALSYLNTGKYELMVSTMETIYELRPDDDMVILRMAEAYYRNGQYEEAVNVFNTITSDGFKERAKALGSRYNTALKLYRNPVKIQPQRVEGVSTIHNDYFASITADGRMISTTVLAPILNYAGDERLQEDIYVSFRKSDGGWTFSRPIDENLNTPDNEGSQSFSADGRYMFFVSCNNPDNIGSCDIYYAIRQGNRWSNPMNLGVPANTEYWESNPCMAPSGDELYFVSNRPGGLGKRDIWKVKIRIKRDGTLEPYDDQPLGAPINTQDDEYAPFMHADGETFYFSSNGHEGMGGSDIFVCRINAQGQVSMPPQNLGYPINTNGDESGFVVNGEGTRGYYASDRIDPDSETKLDIYEISLPEPARPAKMLYSPGRVYDASTGHPLQAYVEVFDQSSNHKYFESTSDRSSGEFVVFLPEKGSYGFSVQQTGYLFYTEEIRKAGDSIVAALQPIVAGSTMTVENLFFDTDKDEILPTSYAVIEHLYQFLRTNKKVKIEIVGHTDNVGQVAHNNDLSRRRAESLKNALVKKGISASRIETRGEGSSQPVADNSTEEGRAKNRRVEVIIFDLN